MRLRIVAPSSALSVKVVATTEAGKGRLGGVIDERLPMILAHDFGGPSLGVYDDVVVEPTAIRAASVISVA